MRQIIKDLIYDTEATCVSKNPFNPTKVLYRTAKGKWFITGRGISTKPILDLPKNIAKGILIAWVDKEALKKYFKVEFEEAV